MRSLLLVSFTGLALACGGPHAGLEVTDARAWRTDDGLVVVDVDLLAYETMGQNIGLYCTRASFPRQAPVEVCRADLEDGDTATIRFTSDAPLGPGEPIVVRVRHAANDTVRHLEAP